MAGHWGVFAPQKRQGAPKAKEARWGPKAKEATWWNFEAKIKHSGFVNAKRGRTLGTCLIMTGLPC